MSHVLTLITFIPIAGMILILALPDSMKQAFKWIAVVATALQLGIAIFLYDNFDTTTSAVQFAEKASGMPAYHISYFVGVDGISISMVLLTALIMFISVFASFGINRAEKGYYAMLLMLDTGMMGVFVSLDFFLFYIFWEVMLLPMYFLIGIWGGPRREYAAIKFFLYTLAGSVLILIALLGFYFTDLSSFVVTPTVVAQVKEQIKARAPSLSAEDLDKKASEAVTILRKKYTNSFDMLMLQRVGAKA